MEKASTVFLLLAVVTAIFAPFGLLFEPPYWLGAALLFGLLAWVLRAFRPRPEPIEPPSFEKHDPTSPATLEALRLEKDRFFRRSPDSPFPAETRASFPGLRYFPLDRDAVFKVNVHEFDEQPKVPIATSTGQIYDYIRYGEVQFEYRDVPCRLTVYLADEYDDNLFVPFSDETSGKTTYGAGRYIELIEGEDGTYLLDFNRAYNPYCAYNSDWTCPIPPVENRLAVEVEAGEAAYEEPHP
jgi:uncharacterized protein (DUF1684 family)